MTVPEALKRHGAVEAGARVSTLELFLDLVFVFTLTQLTHLLAEGLTAISIIQVLLIFGVSWWMYGGYVWLTNHPAPDRPSRRLLLLTGMGGFLVQALAIPEAFGESGIAFGFAYLTVVLVHTGLFLQATRAITRVAVLAAFRRTLRLGPGVVRALIACWRSPPCPSASPRRSVS